MESAIFAPRLSMASRAGPLRQGRPPQPDEAVPPAMNRRQTYSRREAIPPELKAALDTGRAEPLTLAEWLAVDPVRLLASVLPAAGLGEHLATLITVAEAEAGVMARQRAIGAALFAVVRNGAIYEHLATHPSGVVREWAALMLAADPDLSLAQRLEGARRFAADPGMNVREIAWSSFRPFLARQLDEALVLLQPWVRDADPNIRRCAIESMRPRGVWCNPIERLKHEPELALPLLERVRADRSRYVQLSVANWLNDASKHRPEWVGELAERWLAESPEASTRWIVNHALRSLRKLAA